MVEKIKEFLEKWENTDYKNRNYYYEYKYNNKDEEIEFEEELDKLFNENYFYDYKFINIGYFDAPSGFVSYNSLSIVKEGDLYVFPIIFVNDYEKR